MCQKLRRGVKMTLGERLRQRRELLRKTQDDVAAAAGTTKQAIYKYETGIVTNIPLDKIDLIAAALETTPQYLLGWTETKNPVTNGDGKNVLDIELAREMRDLTPEEADQVRAYVKALKSGKA
jgi:transcriptional regulator with XRE-family HTH domain